MGLAASILLLLLSSLFLSHFNIGITDGVTFGSALPSTGWWDIVGDTVAWFSDILTFNVTDGGQIISVIMWCLLIIVMIQIIILIRGVAA